MIKLTEKQKYPIILKKTSLPFTLLSFVLIYYGVVQ